MKKILFLILVTATLYSQESGSPYTRFGFGVFNNSVSTRALGKAGTSIAVFDDNELNNLNPASWAKIKNTVFSSGLVLESSKSEDDKASKNYKNMNFSNTVLGIPLQKDKEFVLAIGIYSKSKVGYNVTKEVVVNSIPAEEIYFGSGGLSEFQIGLTYSPVKNLDFGFKTGYNFGEIQHSGKLKFNNSDYTDNEYRNSMYTKGFSYTGGIIYSGLDKMLNINSGNIGIIFSPKFDLRAKRERYSYFTSSSTSIYDTLISSDVDATLPMKVGVGLNLGFTERLNIGFDYLFSGWENYKLDGSNEGLKNSQRFSVSCELMPDKEFLASYTARMRYSVGLYYEKMNLEINGTRINEYGVTLGCGIPLSRNAALNTALIYGRRGKNENGLILDSFIKLQFSLALNELWFVNTEDQ